MSKKVHMEEADYQPEFGMSFADLMTTLVGTFLILLMYFMFQISDETQKVIEKVKKEETKNNKAVELLRESEKKIEEVVGIKKSIVEELKKQFSNSDIQILIDQESGAIRLSDKILFKTDSSEISADGKRYLNKFIPKYMSTLLNGKVKGNISEIIIEGHTDNNGTYVYNLDLSQRRAFSVTKYIISDEMPYFEGKDQVRNYLTSTGKSFSQLVYVNEIVDQDSSRRVEFKFRLKEQQALNEIQKILAD